ncbi:uncharacterized protein BcabD6B2_35660 [Babesia caballi]|uniref:Uncharacterized protein n=1 Tax=Babesia caballi TaxID=5871 RepID=A0AAV4LWB9_BABCB|nr:hypothetical protein, conserved [Babesia caballi]
MAEEKGVAKPARISSSHRKAHIVDNFVLLFGDRESADSEPAYLSDEATSDLSEEQIFRRSVRGYMSRIDELRRQITDKYLAKQLTQDKLDAQLFELRVQSRFSSLAAQKRQAIKVNYQRKLLLCEKIYTLAIQLQTLYIELAELLDRRAAHTTEIHRRSRLCATALYEYKKRTESA